MRDQRLRVFRSAVDGLLESLDAVVRLSRWNDSEARPEPLVAAAAKVQERLGTADRLAASKYNGPPADVAKVAAMCAMMKRLDAAFLAYSKGRNGADAADATSALEAEISAATDLVRSST